MAIYHTHFEQRSSAWLNIRLGIPTASGMDRIVTAGGKPSRQCGAYMNRLLAEWALGEPIENDYQSEYMQLGAENEPAAVRAFEFQTGLETSEVGFVTTDDGLIGCSPDRLVGKIGTLELKCPAAQTQIAYLRDPDICSVLEQSIKRGKKEKPETASLRAVGTQMVAQIAAAEIAELVNGIRSLLARPEESVGQDYRIQAQSQLWICEREKSWVSAYHPRLAPVILEIPRDEELISKIAAGVTAFVEVMLEKRAYLEQKYGPFVRPEPIKSKRDDFEGFGVTEEDVEIILRSR